MNFIIYIIALAILMGILKILMFPIKLIFRLLLNSLLGGIVLYFLAQIGIFMVISWWSLLLTAILGIPGVVIAVVLSLIL